MSRASLPSAALLILAGAIGLSCATTTQQKSTGTNWIECKVDADCREFPGARCRNDDICVDANGKPIDAKNPPDGGSASGGASNGGAGGTPPNETGGASSGNGGASTGAGGTSASAVDCFSPGQNLDHAYDNGAVGCRCAESTPGLCVKGTTTAVALECSAGHWIAVQDGACSGCWTPDQPELALAMPSRGCACAVEDASACFYTTSSSYRRAICMAGKWTLDTTEPAVQCDTCDSDARCGFGGKCTNGHCAADACEVDGVKYAIGAANIPDPFSCNTCQCAAGGTLGCTKIGCPIACPDGTTATHACVSCGLADGCALMRTGCLPPCDVASDCTAPGTFCDTTTHLCTAGCP